MVDPQPILCCMCGDIGFHDKLFRCSKCRHRFQHSYCSNYCDESTETPVQLCDWCHSEQRSVRQGGAFSRRSVGKDGGVLISRSGHSASEIKIKQNDGEEKMDRGKNASSSTPSPRPAARRYKLLKDVLC